MNNVKKDNLVKFLKPVISKVSENDVRDKLNKILDKVNNNELLDKDEVDYVVNKTFSYAENPRFFNDNIKKAFVKNVCDYYNIEINMNLNNNNEKEIDRIEARINEITADETDFISNYFELLKNGILNKIDSLSLSTTEQQEKKNELSSITASDALGNFINDNFNEVDKDKLFVELLDKRIDDIDASQTNIEKSYEVNDDNLYLIAKGLSNYFLLLSRDNQISEEERNKYDEIAKNLSDKLRDKKINITVDEINELISDYSIDKEKLFFDSYTLRQKDIKSLLEKFEAKVGDKKLVDRIEELTDKLKRMSNNNFTSTITPNIDDERKQCVDDLRKLYEKLYYYDNNYLDQIRNIADSDISSFVFAFNNLKHEYKDLLDYKAKLDKNIDSINKNKDESKKNIKELTKLNDFKLIFNERSDLRNITLLFDKIRKKIVDNLKNDEDFKNLKRKEKLQEISDLVDNNNDYNRMISYPDNLINKEKLTKELKKKIAKDLKIKKKKKVKIENNEKKWHKAILYAAGIAAGFGLNAVAPVLATNGLIVYGVARASLAITKKVGGVIINSMKSHKSGRKVIKAIKSFGNKDKHPYISKVVSGYKKVMKSPKTKVFLNGTKCFLNGMAIGIGVGKVVNNFMSSSGGPSGGYDPPTGDTGGKSLPDKPDTPVVNDPGVSVDTSSDVPTKVEVGQHWNVEDIKRGFIDSTRDPGTSRHLMGGELGDVFVDKINGEMVHVKSVIDGEDYGWFTAKKLLNKGDFLGDVVEEVEKVGRNK